MRKAIVLMVVARNEQSVASTGSAIGDTHTLPELVEGNENTKPKED